MFDIGFFELLVIGIVTLVVVGPERLPGLARTAGRWMGKARHFVGAVKSEIDREIAAENLKQHLQQQAGLEGLHQIVEETQKAGRDIEEAVTDTATAAEQLSVGGTEEPPPAAGDDSAKQS